MLIRVVTPSGRVVEIAGIEPSHTIYIIKKRFHELEGVHPNFQQYIDLYGRFLKDSQTVKELSLREGFNIYLLHVLHWIHELDGPLIEFNGI